MVKHIFAGLSLLLLLGACSETSTVKEKEEGAGQTIAEKEITEETEFANDLGKIPSTAGVVGLFKVPEMLSLSVMDSATAGTAAEKVQLSYTILEKAVVGSDVTRNGPYGQISYTNDTSNFKYECFVLIKKMPEKQPADAMVVVQEAEQMLAFNFYGPYAELYKAYAQLREYMNKLAIKQGGPMREYYITDPREQPDPRKWRTLLLMPVRAPGAGK